MLKTTANWILAGLSTWTALLCESSNSLDLLLSPKTLGFASKIIAQPKRCFGSALELKLNYAKLLLIMQL